MDEKTLGILFDLILAFNVICRGSLYYGILAQVTRPRRKLRLYLYTIFTVFLSMFLDYHYFLILPLIFYINLRFIQGMDRDFAWFYSLYTVYISESFHVFKLTTLNAILLRIQMHPLLIGLLIGLVDLISPQIHKLILKRSHIKDIKPNVYPDMITNTINKPSIIILIFGIITLWLSLFYENTFAPAYSLNISVPTYFLLLVSLFIFIFIFFFIDSRARVYNEKVHQINSLQQINDMNDYISYIETTNQRISSYKHDMNNIFLSLRYAIEDDDFDTVKDIYHDVIKGVSDDLNKSSSQAGQLHFIKNPPLKSIMASKVLTAEENDVEINVSLIEDIDEVYIDLVDYLRIASILLDNATEAALSTDRPMVNFTMVYLEGGDLLFVVENNYAPDYITSQSIEDLYELGVTSNEEGRGIGLANIKALQDKYPKDRLSVHTENTNGIFRQSVTTRPNPTTH